MPPKNKQSTKHSDINGEERYTRRRRSSRVANRQQHSQNNTSVSMSVSSAGSLHSGSMGHGAPSWATDHQSVSARGNHSLNLVPASLTNALDGLNVAELLGTDNETASGLWGLLPEELIEIILSQCSYVQLGMLSSTCNYFHTSRLIERLAKGKVKEVPRAKGLKPMRRDGETTLALLHFVNNQSAAAAQATAVSSGGQHTTALLLPETNQGTHPRHGLYSFGRNFHGQLGASDFEDKKEPALVGIGFRQCHDNPAMEEETMPAVVACGSRHSTCISRRGELFSWGLNKTGELGLGRWSSLEVSSPIQCPLFQIRIVSVACGFSHTLGIGENGSLWSCGSNDSGQLGFGNLIDCPRLQAVPMVPGTRIVSAAAGSKHSVALASDGSLFTWGSGSRGQLGHSHLQQLPVHAAVPIVILQPTKISRLDPANLSSDNRITAISAGSFHTMALTVGGSIMAFGGNESGCLGLGDFNDRWKPTKVPLAVEGDEKSCLRVIQLACGAHHSVALFSRQGRAEVRTAGCNKWGQLGLGNHDNQSRFSRVFSLSKVSAVQAGDEHSAAVTEDGGLYLWGRGDSGQLGLGDARNRARPTRLKGFAVVHPDKTLRRSKRSNPFIRQLAVEKQIEQPFLQ